MSKHVKQLTQRCNNPNCAKAFCRTVADIPSVEKISKILALYGDALLCRKISKAVFPGARPGGNLIIECLLYTLNLIYGGKCDENLFEFKDAQFLRSIEATNEVDGKGIGKFSGNPTGGLSSKKPNRPTSGSLCSEIIDGSTNKTNLTKPNLNSENPGMADQEMVPGEVIPEHKFCEVTTKDLTVVNAYLLVGILHVFLAKFKTCPNFNLSLVILRIFNAVAKAEEPDVAFYKTLASVFLSIRDGIKDVAAVGEHPRCPCGCCLFHFYLTRDDLVEGITTVTRLIDLTDAVNFREDIRVSTLFEILDTLFAINKRLGVVSDSVFVLRRFFSTVNLKEELKFCRIKLKSSLEYSFAIPIEIKAEILKIQNGESMKAALQDAFFRSLFQGVTQPYLFINVRRDRLYVDTLRIIADVDEADIRKQLKVKFLGEEGVDSGGIKKEYFLLIGHEIENDISIFTQTNNRLWFRKGVDLRALNTLGKIVGVALYNDVVLNVPFPSLIFKKLLNIPLNFEDLEEIEPEVFNSLKNLERCTPEDLRFLDQNFTADFEVLGRRVNYELKEGGTKMKVKRSNLDEFIRLYWTFLMETVIVDEFRAFFDGFYSIIKFESIKNFQPHELEKILMGVDDLDFDLIKKTTTYSGYEPHDCIVEYFWEFFYEMGLQKKKRLIQFITGNDRLPVGGSKALNLIIMKNGCDTDRLPSSQTCFNTLLLPKYSTREKLRDKLGKAINLTAGFFLM